MASSPEGTPPILLPPREAQPGAARAGGAPLDPGDERAGGAGGAAHDGDPAGARGSSRSRRVTASCRRRTRRRCSRRCKRHGLDIDLGRTSYYLGRETLRRPGARRCPGGARGCSPSSRGTRGRRRTSVCRRTAWSSSECRSISRGGRGDQGPAVPCAGPQHVPRFPLLEGVGQPAGGAAHREERRRRAGRQAEGRAEGDQARVEARAHRGRRRAWRSTSASTVRKALVCWASARGRGQQ